MGLILKDALLIDTGVINHKFYIPSYCSPPNPCKVFFFLPLKLLNLFLTCSTIDSKSSPFTKST